MRILAATFGSTNMSSHSLTIVTSHRLHLPNLQLHYLLFHPHPTLQYHPTCLFPHHNVPRHMQLLRHPLLPSVPHHHPYQLMLPYEICTFNLPLNPFPRPPCLLLKLSKCCSRTILYNLSPAHQPPKITSHFIPCIPCPNLALQSLNNSLI